MESANTALILFITQDLAHASGTGPLPICDVDLRNDLFADELRDSDALWTQRRDLYYTAVPPRLPQVDTFDQSRHVAQLAGDQMRAARRADLAQKQIARRAQRQPRGGGGGPARGR